MLDNPTLGRRLLASGRLDPILASAAVAHPHDLGLALRVANILLDDVEAMIASLPTSEATNRLPPRQRVAQAEVVVDELDRCRWQLDDARTIVYVARAEAAA